MKEISKTSFDKQLKAYPKHTCHTIGFCTPPITFYWKHPAEFDDDRSFGRGAFLVVQHDYDLKTGRDLPNKYFEV